jgi:ribonucleoside-triphosphate reductase
VVTLNLPRLGHLAKNEEDFLARLDKLIDLAQESLVIKRKELERFTNGGLYPYTTFYLRQVKEATGSYWTNHFSTIGVVGGNEASLNLLGEDLTTPRGQAFMVRVLQHMRARLADIQEKTGDFFNLEATPAEGTSFRLARLDQARYSGLHFANASRNDGHPPFYTNSTHLPVSHTDDLFDALELQDDLQCCYTGGTVLHGFVGEEITDPRSVSALVRTITKNFRLPYFTITPTFSVCQDHGDISGEHPICPDCQGETEVYSRVVGYLRPVRRWNDGKQQEFAQRRVYQLTNPAGGLHLAAAGLAPLPSKAAAVAQEDHSLCA